MNKGLSGELKAVFPNIIPFKRPLVVGQEIKDPNWVSGFTSGEGCFFVKSNANNSRQFVLGCQITQHNRDSILMKKFLAFFNCGRIETSRALYVNFIVTKLLDVNKIIIPFFENYPVLGSKSKDFLYWKRIAKLMSEKAHLTEEGAEEILRIKSNMNASRNEEE